MICAIWPWMMRTYVFLGFMNTNYDAYCLYQRNYYYFHNPGHFSIHMYICISTHMMLSTHIHLAVISVRMSSLLDITVSFNQLTFRGNESDGSVQILLILSSNKSMSDISVIFEGIDQDAKSKLFYYSNDNAYVLSLCDFMIALYK